MLLKELKKLVFNCTQDNNWHVRNIMTKHLKPVVSRTLSKVNFQDYFYDEMLELLNDMDIMVRLEALEAVVEIIPSKINPEQMDKDIVPAFVRHLETEGDEECDQRMSAIFGKFLFNLPLEKQRKDNAVTFIKFYLRICTSSDLEVRKNAAVMLPCFFYYYGNYDQDELDFLEIYSEFSQDDSKEIKAIVGRGIHEALTLTEKAGKNVFLFGDPFQNLIKQSEQDLEVTIALIPNLGDSLGTFVRCMNSEIVNGGIALDSFSEDLMKSDTADIFECYQFVKSIIDEVFKL